MLQWLEREGYDVSYATNVDVDDDPNLLLSHKAFLSVGHDEYWSWQMRDNVERARDAGVNLGFFSGNTSVLAGALREQRRQQRAGSHAGGLQDLVGAGPDYAGLPEDEQLPLRASEPS